MKATIDISDSLFAEAKSLAKERGLTMRQLVEDGLRVVIDRERVPRKSFKLRDGSFKGQAIVKKFTWPEIRASIYEGRGE